MQSQVRFNRVPKNFPLKVPGSLGAKPGQVQQCSEKVPEKVWEALVQSQVRFNRVPEKVPGGFGAEPGQVQQGSGEGLGGFGAEPGQVQQGSGEGVGGFGAGSTGFRRRFRTRSGRLWCRARSGSTGFRKIFR